MYENYEKKQYKPFFVGGRDGSTLFFGAHRLMKFDFLLILQYTERIGIIMCCSDVLLLK